MSKVSKELKTTGGSVEPVQDSGNSSVTVKNVSNAGAQSPQVGENYSVTVTKLKRCTWARDIAFDGKYAKSWHSEGHEKLFLVTIGGGTFVRIERRDRVALVSTDGCIMEPCGSLEPA